MTFACLLTEGTTMTTTDDGDLVITVRLGNAARAKHAQAALRHSLRQSGQIVIDWGMPIAVASHDVVVNR